MSWKKTREENRFIQYHILLEVKGNEIKISGDPVLSYNQSISRIISDRLSREKLRWQDVKKIDVFEMDIEEF